MTLAAFQVADQAARYGNDQLMAQINQRVELLKSGVLKKVPMSGMNFKANIFNGANFSTTFIDDGELLPEGSAPVPVQLEQLPIASITRIFLGPKASNIVSGKADSFDLVVKQYKAAANDLSRRIGRAVYDSQLGPPDGAYSSWTGTLTTNPATSTAVIPVGFADVTGFRVGEAVDVSFATVPAGAVRRVFTLNVVSIAYDANGISGDVTFGTNVPGATYTTNNATVVTGYAFATTTLVYLRGCLLNQNVGTSAVTADVAATLVPNNIMPSLTQIASTTEALHGVTPASSPSLNWIGNTFGTFGVLSQESLARTQMQIWQRSEQGPHALLLGPAAGAAYASAAITGATQFGFGTNQAGLGARREVGANMDKYNGLDAEGSGLRFLNGKVVIDANCPALRAYFHSIENVKLGMWQEPKARTDGNGNVMVNRTRFSNEIMIDMQASLVCFNRQASGMATGITGL